jgi:hypothetical protein
MEHTGPQFHMDEEAGRDLGKDPEGKTGTVMQSI